MVENLSASVVSSSVSLPLSKTCLYMAYAFMSWKPHPVSYVKNAIETGSVSIDTEISEVCMEKARLCLNEIDALISRLSKDGNAERLLTRLVEMAKFIGTEHAVRESDLCVLAFMFRQHFGCRKKDRKSKNQRYEFAPCGKVTIVPYHVSFMADGVDVYGKYFRLYSVTDEDAKVLYVVRSDEWIDDFLEADVLTLNVEKRETRKGVNQSLCSLVIK